MKFDQNSRSLRTFTGIIWSIIERFSGQGIQFIMTIILARYLSPSDFGLMALISVFFFLIQSLNESGFSIALINKLDRDELDFSTIFFANTILGILSFLLLYFASNSIGYYFNDPQIGSLVKVLSINAIIGSMTIVPVTKLTIDLNFKLQAKATFLSALFSGLLSISYLLIDISVYSLVIQSLSFNFVYFCFLLKYSKWKPSLCFSYFRFKNLFLFSYKLTVSKLISSLTTNLFTIFISKYFSIDYVGYFNRAQSIQSISVQNITSLIQRVSTPLLCEVQESEKEIKRVLFLFIVSTSLIVFPLITLLIVLSESIIVLILTDKWIIASSVLQLLAPTGFFFIISTFNRNVFNATGRTDLALQSQILRTVISLLIIIFMLPTGFWGLIYSLQAISIIEAVIDIYYSKKQIKVGYGEIVGALSGISIACVIMSIIVIMTSSFFENHLLKAFLGVISGLTIYLWIIYSFNIGNSRNLFGFAVAFARQNILKSY